MTTEKAILIIAILFLVGVALFLWHTNAQVDRDIILAETEADQIEKALDLVAQAAKEKIEELNHVKVETREALEASDRKIKQLQEETTEAQDRIARIAADKRELEEHLDQLLTAEVEPDPQPIEEVLASGIQLYPDRDFSGATIQANSQGRALFQVMVEEIGSRRGLAFHSDQLQADCQDQIARIQAVVKEHELRELAMGKAYQAQEEANGALLDENLKLKDWGRNLEDQVKIYKKRQSWPWLDKAEKALALYAVIDIVRGALK